MGACASSQKEEEVDIYMDKYHKRGNIVTNKNDYEVSKQQFASEQAKIKAKQPEDELIVKDEMAQRQKLNDLTAASDEMLFLAISSQNQHQISNKIVSSGFKQIERRCYGDGRTTKVQEFNNCSLPGEQGTGGRPMKQPNPYLMVDLTDPDDQILFQGELQKYKPGFSGAFIDRWVQVTSRAIRYFASKPGSTLAAGKPLMAVPIIGVKSVERVEYDLKLKKTDKKGRDLLKHTFEIFLKEDFLDIFLRHDYEQLFLPETNRKNKQLLSIQKENKMKPSPSKRDIKERYIAEEENRGEEPLGHAAMATLNTHGGAWSNRAGTWPLSERRLIFSAKKEIVTEQWVESLIQILSTVNGQEPTFGDFDGISKINMIDNSSKDNDTTDGI